MKNAIKDFMADPDGQFMLVVASVLGLIIVGTFLLGAKYS